MTEQELREKIVDVLSNMQNFGERLEQISQTGPLKIAKIIVSNEKIADALIAAGIGDVSEWKHRAEVAERALMYAIKIIIDTCESNLTYEYFYNKFLQQAEKELQEERKDD